MRLLILASSFLLLFLGGVAGAQSMVTLDNYMNKNLNNMNDWATRHYIYSRCAAVGLYTQALLQTRNLQPSNRSKNLYEFFNELAMNTYLKEGKKTIDQLTANYLPLLKKHADIYKKDGDENFARTGEYTSGYIIEDLQICVDIQKTLSK